MSDIGASDDVRLPSDATQKGQGRVFMSTLCADQRRDRPLDQGRGAGSPVGDRRFGHSSQGAPLYKNGSADKRNFLRSRRADQRNFNPLLNEDEYARLAVARLQLQQAEVQLRIENCCFDVANVQLQIQVEKTATAKAQLAVEEAHRSIRQLDIDLDQQQAAAASLKADHEAARQVDLDKQAVAQLQLEKEAAQLLDAQKERAISEVDLQYQQQQVSLSYMGLQQARLRNKTSDRQTAEVDLALVQLGVISPVPYLEEAAVKFKGTCGFVSTEPADHLAECEPDEFVCSKCDADGLSYEPHQKELWWACAHRSAVICHDCDLDASDSDTSDSKS